MNVNEDLNTLTGDCDHTVATTSATEASADVALPVCTTQLLKGSQELVLISHVVDPHDFFVHRVCDQELIKEVLREYHNSISEPKPQLGSIAKDQICLVYSKTDRCWLRCRVLTVGNNGKNDQFKVYCYDVASIEIVSINELRLLPPGKWFSQPPRAIHCSLANCEPTNGKWTNDDVMLFQSILEKKEVMINILQLIKTKEGIKYNCHVTTLEQNISLAHALVYHERAEMIITNLQYPIKKPIEQPPEMTAGNSDFTSKSYEDIYITNIVTPDKFFVRKIHQQKDYKRLNKELNEVYSSGSGCEKIYHPQKGMLCVVNTKEKLNKVDNTILSRDVTWARCVVLSIEKGRQLCLLLVDVGLRLLVHWSSLRIIQSRFTKLRALATECHLAGIIPENKISWSEAAINSFRNYKDPYFLYMKVEENSVSTSVGVRVYVKFNVKHIRCINKELVRCGHAAFGQPSFKALFPKRYDDQGWRKERVYGRIHRQRIEEDVVIDKSQLRWEVKILNYQSPSNIHLMFVDQKSKFDEMFSDIQKYYSRNIETKGKTEWEVGEKCCTMSMQWEKWCRASIFELNGDEAKVFYVDLATVETVQTSDLKVLAPEFELLHFAALKCHLYGIMPGNGNKWSSISTEFLQELINAYKKVFIKKPGNSKGNSMPIEIWVYHTIEGGALEADISEWRCLNKVLIEEGISPPNKFEKLDANKYDDLGEELKSFANVSGLLSEWLHHQNKPPRPKEIENVSNTSTAGTQETENKEEFEIIKEWLPAEPFQSAEFTAFISFVDRDGILYMYDEAQNEIDLIESTLSRYLDPDFTLKGKKEDWMVGEPCIFLSRLYNNGYYRGTVVEVNHIASTCLVHSIDYGSEETCPFANMAKSIAILNKVPIQAHRCKLGRIIPVGSQWDLLGVKELREVVLDKKFLIKILDETVDGITPIDLFDGKWCLNNSLVHRKWAVYADGHKKKRNRKS